MAYQIRLSPAAERHLRKLPAELLRRLVRKIDSLAAEPRPQGAEKLSGEDNFLRVRVGDYRIIYTIQDDALIVLVLSIGHRREIYRRLR